MGLAGPKRKQRIPADPRNLGWAEDASRFGLAYLSKFGWDASQGLGTSGDGIKTHLKVQQKLDAMGIGAQRQRDPDGIAWKQNKDFEALLKRLNESAENGEGADDDDDGCGRERERERGTELDEGVEERSGDESSKKRKRKRKDRDDRDAIEKAEKKRKKEKREKSSRIIDPSSEPARAPPPEPSSGPIPKPRPMAHRARIRAAKRIADKSASAISEILGIAPSSSTTTTSSSPAPTPSSSSSTPAAPTAAEPLPSLDNNLSTSTKSVADYFREKLVARKSSSSASPASPSCAPSGSATPGIGAARLGLGLGSSNARKPDDDGEEELARGGIGSQSLAAVTDDRDELAEKQRKKKAERRAEKRKRREAEAGLAPSDASEEQAGQNTLKKRKEREKRKQRAPANGPDGIGDAMAETSDFPTCSLSRPDEKPKKERKKKRS